MVPEENRNDPNYWNWRVATHLDREKEMIWYGAVDKYDRFTNLAEAVLSQFKDKKVLDVGCGYGRFAHIFKPENYLGVDFSEEMIRLARQKNPGYKFEIQDINTWETEERFDMVFESMAGNRAGRFENNAQVVLILSPAFSTIKYLDI